jgi:tellurite resistance protein TerC
MQHISIWVWLIALAVVVSLLTLDLGVFNRKEHRISLREAALMTAVWVGFGLAFGVLVYFIYENHWFGVGVPHGLPGEVTEGWKAVELYITGYFLEESLSIDNLFVFAMLFGSFRVLPEHQHRVLFWGILGAIITRSTMIFGGVWLLTRFSWLFYVFGAYLVITGVKMILPKKEEEEQEPKENFFVRKLRTVLPITPEFSGSRFMVRVEGRRMFTKLFLVLIVVEFTDVLFALDSVPAVLAITTDPFIVLTSNIFAILGLRSLYFVIAGAMDKFAYLGLALSGILMFIGAKMVLHKVVHIPTLLSLGVILTFVITGIVASQIKAKRSSAD